MVNEKIKNPTGPSSDSSRRSPSVESIPHRPRKSSLSTMLATKAVGNQSLVREEAEAQTSHENSAPIQGHHLTTPNRVCSSTETYSRSKPEGSEPLGGGPY